MIRYIGLVILLISLPLLLSAQNISRIDSLKKVVASSKGLRKFDALNSLGFEYRLSYPDSTIFYCEQAFDLGNELEIKLGMSKPLSFIGLASSYKGDYETSFDYHSRAIAIAEAEPDSIQLGFCYNNFGRLFFDQGDMVRAYKNFIKAREIFEAVDDKSGLSYVYRSLSNLYKSQHDIENALENSLQAYELRKQVGEPRGELSALMELGLVYEELKDTLNAIQSLRKADSIATAINDQISQAEIDLALGEILLHQHQLNEAHDQAQEAYKIVVRTENRRLLPRANLLLGRLAFEEGRMSPAIAYLNKVIEEATRTGNLLQQHDANFFLSKIYTRQNNKAKAVEHTNRYLILQESIQNVDLTRQIERLQFQLEIEKKEKENEILTVQQTANEALINQQKLQNTMLVIIIAFISVLAGVHWWNSRKRKEINEKLGQQNEEIKAQRSEIVRQNEKLSRRNNELSDLNHEKDTLMSIVAHDLKAPLNRIKGLTDIMGFDEHINNGEQQTYIKLIQDSTRAGLDLIKDLLDVNMLEENVQPKLSTFDISTFLLEKMESFRPAAESKKIHLQITRIESEDISSDADYLGRIIDNLISNAIKFSKNNSTINLAAGKSGNGFWISIKDEGPGFSERDKAQLFQKFRKLSAQPTAGESSNGLGLAIVKTLVDRLGGDISLRTEPGKGSEFIIQFTEMQVVSKGQPS